MWAPSLGVLGHCHAQQLSGHFLQVLVVLGHNITGDDVTVLARAEGQYIDAQVRFRCYSNDFASWLQRGSLNACGPLICVCPYKVQAMQVPILIATACSDYSTLDMCACT